MDGWMDHLTTSPLEHRSLSGANKQTILPQITLMHTTAHKDTAACRIQVKQLQEKQGGKGRRKIFAILTQIKKFNWKNECVSKKDGVQKYIVRKRWNESNLSFASKKNWGCMQRSSSCDLQWGCDLPIKRLIMNCRAVHLKFQEHSTYFVFGIKIWKASSKGEVMPKSMFTNPSMSGRREALIKVFQLPGEGS